MRNIKLSAGDIIEATCTRCRAVLNHTIVAMVEERVVRVECNTCHGVHNYRGKAEKKAKTGTSPTRAKSPATQRAKKDPKATEREEWETLSATFDDDQSFPYDMNGKFRLNNLIDHASFGLGIVTNLIPPNKMEVLFQQGKKLLRCQLQNTR